jgi:transcriptional regulator with XRE-family HTH domain
MAGQGHQAPLSRREQRELTFTPRSVGEALQAAREAEGLSRSALAEKLRVNDLTIRNWETGKAPLIACRLFSYAYPEREGGAWRVRAIRAEAALQRLADAEQWRTRAVRAERALRRLREVLGEYRSGVTQDLAEYREQRRAA